MARIGRRARPPRARSLARITTATGRRPPPGRLFAFIGTAIMAWTFTRHEEPQRLAAIMGLAWRANRRRKAGQLRQAMRLAWALYRRRSGRRLPPRPRGLLSYLLRVGGLRPHPELRAAHVPLCYWRRRGLDLDTAARWATDAGYDARDCRNRLLEMMTDETFGRRHLAECDRALELELDAWQAHHVWLIEDHACPF